MYQPQCSVAPVIKRSLALQVDRLTNTISVIKATNFELNQTVEQLAEKCEELTGEQLALAEQLEVMEAAHAEERLKLEATSSQQTKLIDFLQCKSEGQTPKKKRVSSLSFCFVLSFVCVSFFTQARGRAWVRERRAL